MDREAWQATDHGVAKSWTQLRKDLLVVHNVNIPTESLVNSVSFTLAVEVDLSSTGLEVGPW